MSQENAHKFLFVMVLLGLVVFVGRDEDRGEEELGRQQIQATSLAQVVAPPLADEVQTLPVTRMSREEAAAAVADTSSSAFFRTSAVAVPKLHARAVLVADLETGQELFAQNPYQRWPIASITKLVTAAVAANEIGEEKPVTIDEAAVAAEGAAGDFRAGETYRVKDLIRALIAVSSNDAAEALARHYGRDVFMAKMNEFAASLGMIQTSFADPSGISSLDQSSPGDLQRLMAYLVAHKPDIMAVARSSEIEIREISTGVARRLASNNAFSGRPDFLGGKTGYTEEAGGNLVSVFSYLNRPVFIAVLGTNDRFGETEKILAWVRQSYGTAAGR